MKKIRTSITVGADNMFFILLVVMMDMKLHGGVISKHSVDDTYLKRANLVVD